jgi:hypothetical protein
MSKKSFFLFFFLGILTFSSFLFTQEVKEDSLLVEGVWTHCGVRSILGQGVDTTITLKKEGMEWRIAYERILYPSLHEKGAKPELLLEGPYLVRVEDQEMVLSKENQEVRYTFICSPERLILPAFVQKKPGEWVFRSDREFFTVRCEHNPFEVPVGKAQIPGVLLGKGYYSYEEAPRSRFWPSAQYLRFFERSEEKGQLCERFRLIFDEYGSPRYERLLSTGERSSSEYSLNFFFASQTQK